ncbi:MAG: MG2 domain-containing protein [Caldilineaceae bacterium]
MSRRLWLPLLFALLSLILVAALPEPEPSQISAGAPRRLVPTFTPTAYLSPLPTATPLIPPSLIAHEPDEQLLRVRRPTFSLTFDRPMDQASVAAALQITPTVPVDLRWKANNLHIVPRQPLTLGVDYHLTLAAAARDAAGVSLGANAIRFDYTVATSALASVTGPTLGNSAPPIVLYFNFSLDPQIAQQALAFEPPLAGDWQWNENRTVATFTPANRLLSDTNYTVRFKDALVDANGDPLPVPAPQHFTTPLPILPANASDTAYMNPLNDVTLTFDRPMDEAAVAAAFQIDPPITGTLTWQGTILSFHPTRGYFAENTSYTVTITPGIRSAAGEVALQHPYLLNFHTSNIVKQVSFGWGPNAQVLDVAGRRALQILLSNSDAHQVAHPLYFSLYRLTFEQFLAQYASGFRGVAGNEKQTLDLSGAELVKSWTLPPEDHTDQPTNSVVREVILPKDVPPGLYILNMGPPVLGDQLIVLLTRHVITLKQAEGQLIAWVTDINGGPVQNSEVSLYARDGLLLGQGRTDNQGLWRTQVAADPQPLLAVARDGDDVTATGFSNEWRSRNGQWWGWWQPAPKAEQYAAYVYTDRPIYRPGQTVFFKAILRNDDDAALSLPPGGTPVTVRIRDGRDNVVQTFKLVTNAFGTVNGQFALAAGAMLGEYAVELNVANENHRQIFKVQEYHKPDYAVTVATNAAQYVVSDTILITATARYFFGEPVANANLTLKKFMLQPLDWWMTPSNQTQPQFAWYDFFPEPLTAKTDANGVFTMTWPAQFTNMQQPWAWDWQSSLQQSTWGIEITVDDGSHQTVSNFAMVKVFNAAEGLHLDTGGYVKEPGTPFTVTVAARTVAGEPVAARALQLAVERNQWDNGQHQVTTSLYTVTTAANGQATQPLTLDPGYYHLVVNGQDPARHGLKYESWVYVFNQADQWDWRGEGNLSIKADRDTYIPGDQARLVIEATFSGPALVTFERGKTRREQLIELKAPLTVLTTPIQPDDAPNIFVTVNAWQPQDTTLKSSYVATNLPDSRLQTASVALHVPVTDKTLQVTLTPDRTVYAPRDTVTVTVQVRDRQGAPVTAELSLALVDEAIFSLSDELAGPIFDAFYHERLNLVRTYDGMALTRYIGGMGGGGGGGVLANPRSNFPDTAVWLPVVHTDADGRATVTLTLPDTLTSWRLTAKVVTGEKTEVGETKINLVTHQPIILQPSLPHTLVSGDQTELTTLVHNYSDQPQALQVWLQTSPAQLAVHSPVTQTVRLAPGEKRVIGWVATAISTGDAPITIRAQSEPDPLVGDAVRLTLPIQPLAIPDVVTQVGQFTGALTTEVQLPTNALALSSVKLELSRSIAGTLLNGLEYLTGYPYGCVEQTMSRALPNAVVGRAFRQLGVGNPTLQADLPPLINAGLQRLYGYQHNDGGWGWWYDDSTDAYQTAWVIFGLSVTREAGYEVDPGVIERGATWLATPKTLDAMDIRTRAFALFSLANAGYGDLPATRALLQEVDKLDTFSQAALALAFHSLGVNDKAEQLVEKLAKTAKVEDGKAYWPSATEDGHYYQKTMSSTTRSTALALAAFVHIQPHHELEPDIVRWLMSQRRQAGWGSTNETSFTLWALTDYLLQQRETTADTTYRVELNGQELTHGHLGRGEPAVTLEIAADQMRRGANRLHIEQSGGGQLYYVINSRTYQAEPAIGAAGNIKLERQYLDITTKQPLTHAVVGQLVQVQLNVQMPDNGFYMLVEDALPGGLEALNESLNTSSHQAVANQEPQYYWQQYGYNEKEVHDDRVTFFITELNAGQRTFTYLARVTRAGTFVAMPAQAYAMYDATKWGRSASQTFVVDGAAAAVKLPAPLYFLGEDAQIWRLAQDGQTKTKVTAEAAGITAFDVSRVHGRLVYVTADEQNLIEFDPTTKQRVVKVIGIDRQTLPNDQHEDAKMRAPHYSPDGQQISFAYQGINLIASGLTTDEQPQLLRPNVQVDIKTGGDVEKIRLYREAMWSPGGAYLAFYFSGWESTGYELYHWPTKILTPLIYPGYNIPTGFDHWDWGRDEQTAYIGSTSMIGPGPGFFRLDLPQGLLTPIHTEMTKTQKTIFPEGMFVQGIQETATGKLYGFLSTEITTNQQMGAYRLYTLDPHSAPPTLLNSTTITNVSEILWAADSSGALVVTDRPTQEPPYPVEAVQWVGATGNRVEKLPIRGTQLRWGPTAR